MRTTEQKIEETEIKLKQLKEKLKKELAKLEKSVYLYIPELKIEIQTKIHHKNKTYAECEKDLSIVRIHVEPRDIAIFLANVIWVLHKLPSIY